MAKHKLRKEYDELYKGLKNIQPDKFQWFMSNSKYIEWLETKIKNLPPSTVYYLYFHNIFNLQEQPLINIYKTKSGAYRAMKRRLNIEYYKWYNNRIMYGKNRRGNRPNYNGCWFIIEEKVRP